MAETVTALAVVPTADPAGVNPQDLAFLRNAQLSNLTEVAEANVALRNTSNIASREFARWMIGDHAAQLAALATIAQQLGVALPATLDPSHQAEVNQLATLKGAALDQAYGPAGVQDHAQTITLFQQEAAAGASPTLVALAQQSLPLLQAHYEQARVLAGLPPAPIPGISAAPPPAVAPTPTTLSPQDRAFVAQAATSGLAEVAEGQVAAQRGNGASAEFGRWMAADHTAVGAALGNIARAQGFTPPTALTPAQQADLANLGNTSATNFDSVYARSQVVDHAKVLMQFVREAETGTDPALVAFARSGVPILEQHLAGAAELRLSASGLTPPAGDSLGTLSSLVASGTAAANGSLLSDIAGLPPQQGGSVSNVLGHLGSLQIDPQQITQLVQAFIHT